MMRTKISLVRTRQEFHHGALIHHAIVRRGRLHPTDAVGIWYVPLMPSATQQRATAALLLAIAEARSNRRDDAA